MFRHCLRNILPSYISLMAVSVPHVVGGTYIVETVFSYPGISALSYESARYHNYNLLMVLCMMTGSWWIILIPGAFLVTLLMCLTNIGNFLRKAANGRESHL